MTNSVADPLTRLVTRCAIPILLVMAVSAPFVAYGALRALRSTSNDPRQWLPRSFEETEKHEWFQRHFGTDEMAIVSWPGCRLDDPRVEELGATLAESPFFERAYSGRSVLRKLIRPPLRVPLSSAVRQLQGTLVGQDGRSTCLVLVTSDFGRTDRGAAVREIKRLAEESGLSASALRLAGPTVDAAAIDAESRRLLFQLAGISALLTFFIASVRLRSIRLAVFVLAGAVYSTGLTLALLHYTGGSMNLLMTMLPPLIYVLSISAAVHLVNYYRDARLEVSPAEAPVLAVRHGALPCLLATLTTAIGLVSLTISRIDPIRMFGASSAMGVVVSLIVLFTFLPATLRLFPPKLRAPGTDVEHHRWRMTEFAGRYVSFLQRRHLAVTSICLLFMGFCAAGLPGIKSTVKLQDRFLPGSEVMEDYRWLEQELGPMVPLEVVVRVQGGDTWDFLQQLQLVGKVQEAIEALPEAGATLSAANLTPPIPEGGGIRQVVQRRLLNKELADSKQDLVETRFLAGDGEAQLWRISVRASALGSLDYGRFTDVLRERLQPFEDDPQVQITITGVIPLIYKAQRQLLRDLAVSFLAAFAVIFLVMVAVLRSLPAASVAMLANLFPAVVVFGVMSWIRLPVQIGSVMTASAALGIAVDDTVHFLTWFRRGIGEKQEHGGALQTAVQRCAGAMTHTTVICSCGLLVFAASSFVPILHFAWLMVFLLLMALVGDLILLPSMLAGSLGRWFRRS